MLTRTPMPKLRRSKKAQVHQRLLDIELDGDEGGQEHRYDDGEADSEGRVEPVVLVAFLEHGLQRREADRSW
jgi:hypothetical protein